ncbi:MAG: DUF4823 domain-containing protein [Desulfovibrio sp.]|jgi:hypothetical protein|nr:DUF4823 domain-containing protein [Desulfovibrio sp.]
MKRLCLAMLIMMSMILCACSMRVGHTSYQVIPLKDAQQLDGGKSLYVAMPADFQQDGSTQKDSGLKTQQALLKAMEALPGKKVPADTPQDVPAALATSSQSECALLVEVRIVDWSDPPASFQLHSDRGEVMLSVYEVGTGTLLRSDSLTCNGSPTTINMVGAYNPAYCLKPAFAEWSAKAFSK